MSSIQRYCCKGGKHHSRGRQDHRPARHHSRGGFRFHQRHRKARGTELHHPRQRRLPGRKRHRASAAGRAQQPARRRILREVHAEGSKISARFINDRKRTASAVLFLFSAGKVCLVPTWRIRASPPRSLPSAFLLLFPDVCFGAGAPGAHDL